MIKLIGLKRATTIAAMLILNLLIVAALALVIEPMREEAEMRLNMSNAEIARLSSDTQNIKAELSAYDGNLARYEELKRRGFFMSQDRFEASRLLDDMRAKAELTGYNYKIEAIKAISNPDAAASYAELINSRITIDGIVSVLDQNVYVLMYNLATVFPEHARIQRFKLAKTAPLDAQALRAVAGGKRDLVSAEVVLDWLTVVPKVADGSAGGFRGR